VLVPLATLMRRLLTGYAVPLTVAIDGIANCCRTDISILCQKDTYLIEIVPYIPRHIFAAPRT
jgi:hypothetical protein